MAETLEFNDVYQEVKGSMGSPRLLLLRSVDIRRAQKGCRNDGRLRLSRQGIIFKNSKRGKVDNIQAGELTEGIWRRVALGHGLKLLTKNGHLMEKDLCVKGWNWGTVKFGGQLLSFDIGDQPVFEIPLSNVSQCTTGKNEVTLEFHQNDDAEVSLMEVRFYVPPTQEDGVDPVEAFAQNVLSKADVIQATGDAICIFRELQWLTPRGRYDIRIYPTFLHLHGKTFDYKIPYTTVLRLFLLPHKDQRQMFFVISLDPPIKQGQTRYHFLILLFSKDEDISLTLNMNEEEVEKRFEGRLTKNMSGSLYEMVSRVMKALVNRKITVPGNFQGHSGAQCITCSYKASSGLLYPLERGFIYVHKPPVHIRFEEISFVNFARGTTTTRSFDFEIETKQGTQYTFSSIEREEYGKLFDFVNAKKLNIKNRGLKEGMNPSYDDREKIKSDHPGISVTDLSKKAGEIWKGMSKEKKEEWGRKAEDARREYEKAMKEYKGGRGESSKRDKSKKKKKVKVKMEKKSTPSRSSSSKSSSRQLSESFKSKEFVSSDESSSGKNKSKKKRRRSEDSEEEELASTPPSSEDSASGSDE
ncbi:SSRP1 [Cervus elaphus hippelaphus]|uniref:FACT complex subunit SSRP1 n=1 Tax=Cervus elaphus hippelaphus TaxID=46360 RepID=A0A212DHM4_CEREH|nr:SSRP1 [Cervus elaphus hippelaphus]